MIGEASSEGLGRAAKADSIIPASVGDQPRNTLHGIIMASDPTTSPASDRVSGGEVGGLRVADSDTASGVTSRPTHDAGHVLNPGVLPGAACTPPRTTSYSSPAGQLELPLAIAMSPSPFLGPGINPQRMPHGVPELYDPSYMSQMGIGAMRPPWAAASDSELSPTMRDMKAFDAVKMATPNALPVDQIRESNDFRRIVGNSQPTSPAEPSTSIAEGSHDLDAIERSLSEMEAVGATLEDLLAQPLVSDAGAMSNGAASGFAALDNDEHTPPAGDGKITPGGVAGPLGSSPSNGTLGSWSHHASSPGSARKNEDSSSGPAGNYPKSSPTVNTAMDNSVASPRSDALCTQLDQMTEDASSDDSFVDEWSPESPANASENYQFPSEQRVLARASTVGTALFTRDDVNFADLLDSGKDADIAGTTARSRAGPPPAPVRASLKLAPSKLFPLRIPVPDTMLHFFPSSDIPPPKWAPLTQYFPGGRIADPGDPEYRLFDNAGLHRAPVQLGRTTEEKTTLPPGNSRGARGLIPLRTEGNKILSIYDFIDKICPVEVGEDEQVVVHTESVAEFIKAYFVQGPDGGPMLNNPPKGDIPQAQIQDLWYPTSFVERLRIERVIRLLDLEISPATRAALFWILIERQSKCTRDLLRFLAEYPEHGPKEVENRLSAWGYLPEPDRGEDDHTKELPLMDPKDQIKLDVIKETQQLLGALRGAAGSEKKLKFLLPFITKYKAHNTGFYGLMGSDKMIELVVELCNCLQAGDEGADLPSHDIQMGYWNFMHDLRPSLFIARSASLCDLEYSYVVTHRAQVHPDIVRVLASVMAPILERFMEHDNIPQRREIPQEVMGFLQRSKDAKIDRYLDAQPQPVFTQSPLQLAGQVGAAKNHGAGKLARKGDMKKEECRRVMRASVGSMGDGTPGSSPISAAEICSPKTRRRKVQEGQTPSPRTEKRARAQGRYDNSRQSQAGAETLTEATKVGQIAGRKRERDIADNKDGPTRRVKRRATEIVSRTVNPEKAVISPFIQKSEGAKKKLVKGAFADAPDSSPTAQTNKGARSKRLSLAKLRSKRPGNDSDTDSEKTMNRGEQDQQHPGSLVAENVSRQADHGERSSESDEDEEPSTKPSTDDLGKTENVEVCKDSDVLNPEPVREGSRPPPITTPTQQDSPVPGWIGPDPHLTGGDTDEKPPRETPMSLAKRPEKLDVVSAAVKSEVYTASIPSVPQPLRRSPRKHQPKIKYETASSSDDEESDSEYYRPPGVQRRGQKGKMADKSLTKVPRRKVIKSEIKREKREPPTPTPGGTLKGRVGKKGSQPRGRLPKDENGTSDKDQDDGSTSRLLNTACPVLLPIPENKGDINEGDGTANQIPSSAQQEVSTPCAPALSQPLRRSPRKHQVKRVYESDSSSSDADDDSGGYNVPQNLKNVKRVKTELGTSNEDSGQSFAMGEKPLLPPPTLGAEIKHVAKTAAGVAGNRAAASKKAAATRAANHQAFVDKVKAELVAEEQRAADAGGYRPGAVTQAQIKRRMKTEKDKMRVEAAQMRLNAAVSQTQQSAEEKKIATQEKHAAAAKKRAETIAAKKAAISEKARAYQAKPTRSPGTSTQPTRSKSNKTKVKQEKGAAQERIAKARAELEAAELAFIAETGLDLYSEDDTTKSETEDTPVNLEPPAARPRDETKIKIESSAASSRKTDHDLNAKAPARKRKLPEGKRSVANEGEVKSEIHANPVRHRESKHQASVKVDTGRSGGYESRAKLWKDDLVEEPGRVLKTILNMACPPNKQYPWMGENGGDSAESQGAGEASEAQTENQSLGQRKRRKINPKK